MIKIDLITASVRLHSAMQRHSDDKTPTTALVIDICKALGLTAQLVLIEERESDPEGE